MVEIDFDFDDDEDAEQVAANLQQEARLRRSQQRQEHERAIHRQRERAWGRAVSGGFEFCFSSDDLLPLPWPIKVWTSPEFAEHSDWLLETEAYALNEARDIAGNVSMSDRSGLERQADHAAHLRKLVTGASYEPFAAQRSGSRRDPFDVIATALANAYGPDPRPPFLEDMARAGIIPFEPTVISAGNMLHAFHVLGDPLGTTNGWAILHRCPGAGSFGSWRTGAVHAWHFMPDRLADLAAQYADDLVRAQAGNGQQLRHSELCHPFCCL